MDPFSTPEIQLADGQLLQEARRPEGVSALPEDGPTRRVMAEVELRARGRTW